MSGTIGRHLVHSFRPLEIDLREPQRSFDSLELEHCKVLVHLAGKVGVKYCDENPAESYRVNVEGTSKLAKSVMKKTRSRFVYISSGHVYKSTQDSVRENAPTKPLTTYAKQKLLAERSLLNIFRDELHRLTILRVFSILDWNTPHGSLGHRITQAVLTKTPTTIRNALDRRDFLSPANVAQAINHICDSGLVSGTFNLCSGTATTVKSAVRQMVLPVIHSDSLFSYDEQTSMFPYLVGCNAKITAVYPSLELKWQTLPQ